MTRRKATMMVIIAVLMLLVSAQELNATSSFYPYYYPPYYYGPYYSPSPFDVSYSFYGGFGTGSGVAEKADGTRQTMKAMTHGFYTNISEDLSPDARIYMDFGVFISEWRGRLLINNENQTVPNSAFFKFRVGAMGNVESLNNLQCYVGGGMTFSITGASTGTDDEIYVTTFGISLKAQADWMFTRFFGLSAVAYGDLNLLNHSRGSSESEWKASSGVTFDWGVNIGMTMRF